MNDANGHPLAVGDTVQRTTNGQRFVVDGFQSTNLVVCKWPRIPPLTGGAEPPEDKVRVNIVNTELEYVAAEIVE